MPKVNGHEIGPDVDLRGANLRYADLNGANLEGADLGGATLTGANLKGADLRGAKLNGAYLTRAILTDANLTAADLTNALMRGANLGGAELSDTNLVGALWDATTIWPDGYTLPKSEEEKSHTHSSDIFPFKQDGTRIQIWEHTVVNAGAFKHGQKAILDQYSRDGWELVAVSTSSGLGGTDLWFKREKSD